MRTIFINGSPKKRFCASSYFLFLQRLFVGGEKVNEHLRTKGDYQRILDRLPGADAVVFGLPLYVDGVPSHVLGFLEEMERFCKEKALHLKVYVIANNGFIEGKQNEPLMQVMEHFCQRAGLTWGGGVGIGGGVMLNVTRILFFIQAGLLMLNLLLSGIQTGNFLPTGPLYSFLKHVAWLLYFNLGVLFYIIRMSSAIRKGQPVGKGYTRILIPSFVFILFADLFFIIISLFEGGLFRGWLAKKKPDR